MKSATRSGTPQFERVFSRRLPQWRFEPSGKRQAIKLTAGVGREPGFSAPEVMVVMGIIMIIASMALYSYNNVLPTLRADSALQFFEAQLRQAREASVDQRRNIQVTFQGAGEMLTVRQNLNIVTTPPTVVSTTTLSDYLLDPNQMSYTLLSGVPDTPDAFGKAAAVNFNCGVTPLPCSVTFQSDGTVVDRTGNYINGTVFIGSAGNPLTARAITILGTTGRIKGYRYNGKAWF